MGLVEEEHEFGQFQIAHLRQGGVEFGEEPQQIGGVEFGLHHQFVGSQHTHHTLAAFGLDEVVDVERGLTEELVCSLCLQLEEGTLDGADGLGGDVAVFRGVLLGMFRHPVEHGLQILEVEQQQTTVVSDAEDDVEHTVLCLVQLEQS